MQLIDQAQFDTVYHEHFSYLSLHSVNRIFSNAGLRVWHVEALGTHGGSLRVYGCHIDDIRKNQTSVNSMLKKEQERGLLNLQTYLDFQPRADMIKNNLLEFLIEQKRKGKKVAAYGAAAKGNTLLNYAGVKSDLLEFICDAASAKQFKYMPGSHIPILPPETIHIIKPDYVLILPWNISEEVKQQNESIREWGGQFVTAVPDLRIC